jgi:hypothetical protein
MLCKRLVVSWNLAIGSRNTNLDARTDKSATYYVGAGRFLGPQWGEQERSSRGASPSALHLCSHRYAVSLETPAASAVAATVQPSRSIRWTTNHLPYTVSRGLGLACRTRAPGRSPPS